MLRSARWRQPERIDRGYLGRILQLTLLAPDLVAETILDGRQPAELGLPRLLEPFPVEWEERAACAATGAVDLTGNGRPVQLHPAASAAFLQSRTSFRSTPPRGGRRDHVAARRRGARGFDPRPRAGGDPNAGAFSHPALVSDPRPRAGGDTRTQPRSVPQQSCFNPRPRVGGDAAPCTAAGVPASVSIHAPAWGATALPTQRAASAIEFQSTPPRGGRRPIARCWTTSTSCFNPRPRVGGDRGAAERSGWIVSIHAPAWGATVDASASHADWFQSTPPRGGRRSSHRRSPRSAGVSIHAPAWGATSSRQVGARRMRACFNPRPRVGGDAAWLSSLDRQTDVSIHAPAWGATGSLPARRHRASGFNPRPRVGGDASTVASASATRCVSIHAPAWGATCARPDVRVR